MRKKWLVAAGVALLSFAVPASADSQVTAPAPIPTSVFAALPIMTKPLLSPNGRRVVARKVADGRTTLVVLDVDHPETPGRLLELGKANVYALAWAGNDRLLVTVQSERHVLHVDVYIPYLRLIAIDIATGESRIVDKKSTGFYAGDVLYTDPTGAWALVAGQDYVERYPSVKRVDLATGDSTIVEKPRDGVWDWYVDDEGTVRAGIANDDNKWTIWYRDKPEEKLRKVTGKFGKGEDGTVDRFIFRGGNSWIMTNERTGRFALYKYDAATGAIGAPIFEHPEVDIDDVLYNAATGQIGAIEYEDDRRHSFWLDADLGAIQTKLDRALPNEDNVVTAWSDDKNRILVWSQSGSDPGRYFILDRTTSKMHAVVDPYPRIDPALMSPVRPFRFTARDGLQLRGYLTLPKGRQGRNLPLILMPHGGPFDRDHWEYDPLVQFLANRGYAVLQPQFRGSTGFGKSLVEKGYGEWGRKMQDDLDDSVDWLARTGQIDPKRVCIVGASYGGYAALWGSVRNSDRYRCAASLAGVSDLPALLRYDRKFFSAPRYRKWRTQVGGENEVDLGAVSPLNFADKDKIPLLIGHGEEDERVPPKQSRDMVEALTRSGANVSSVFYKDAGHGFSKSADLEDWLVRLEAFLAKYNPA